MIPEAPLAASRALRVTAETFALEDPTRALAATRALALWNAVDDFETRYFTHLLEAHDGNLSRASAEAGITRYYLRELLKRLGLHRVKDDDA